MVNKPRRIDRRIPQVFWKTLVLLSLIASIGSIYWATGGPGKTIRQPVSNFISVSNAKFTVANKPFFVTGANNHYVTFATNQEISRVFDDAVALDANVVRIILQPVIGSFDETKPTIWDWHKEGDSYSLNVNGNYLLYWDTTRNTMGINDAIDGMQRVDRVIAEAKRRNLRLIIAFLDFWAYTGGAQQISAWYLDEDHRPSGGPGAIKDYRFFFSDPRPKADYRTWVKHVIERVNSITNVRYRDDPTIMAWDLMNEPQIESDLLRQQWTAEMSAYVKSLDPKHLVTSGAINKTITDLAKDLVINTIDFGTWHAYPVHDRITPEELNKRIPKYCSTAALYNKPLLLEEFGYGRYNKDHLHAFDQWTDTLIDDKNCSGWLVWVLAAQQQNGLFPKDEHDQFDIVRNGNPLWKLLKNRGINAAEFRN